MVRAFTPAFTPGKMKPPEALPIGLGDLGPALALHLKEEDETSRGAP
jgi:hypothetical protein